MKRILIAMCAVACVAVLSGAEPAPAAPKAAAEGVKAPVLPPRPTNAGLKQFQNRRLQHPVRPGFTTRRAGALSMPGFITLPFGKTAKGQEAHLYRIMGQGGLVADFTDYGARLVRLYAPDRNGNLADVTTGFDTVTGYETVDNSFGATIGRYGNRIGKGTFTIDGQAYKLPLNNGPDDTPAYCSLHGGTEGFNAFIWRMRPVRRPGAIGIEFMHTSPDGHMGYPGLMNVKVTHWITRDNVWKLEYEATCDKPCPINLTNHAYFNLKGVGGADNTILDHVMTVWADATTEVDRGLVPTGKLLPVKGTAFDFTAPHALGERINAKEPQLMIPSNCYDHNFVLRNQTGRLAKAVAIAEKTTGRTLEVWTTEPGIQIYCAGHYGKAKPFVGKDGKAYARFGAVALETQHYPDSPNHPEFPNTILKPGETFRSTTEYRFGAVR